MDDYHWVHRGTRLSEDPCFLTLEKLHALEPRKVGALGLRWEQGRERRENVNRSVVPSQRLARCLVQKGCIV